jgi:hypothetical protein
MLSYNRIAVLKNETATHFTTGEGSATAAIPEEGWEIPVLTEDGLFMMVENMQEAGNWDANKQPVMNISIDLTSVEREVFYKTTSDITDDDGNMLGNIFTERYIDKSRGFWKSAVIEQVQEEPDDTHPNGYKGLYKLTFNGFALPIHSQYQYFGTSVEYYKGLVRLKRRKAYSQKNYNGQTSPNGYGERSAFEVVNMAISGGNLILYISDPDFNSTNPIQTGTQLVNYQPGYKAYLYQNGRSLSEFNILPNPGDGVKYSIATLRSYGVKNNKTHYSRFGVPALMFAQYLEAPQQPQRPTGSSSYATRPDFFGKSGYTFITKFTHVPNAMLFGRSNDGALLKILYNEETVETIRQGLAGINNDAGYVLSWDTFFDIPNLREEDTYPAVENGYQFPLPNGKLFLNIINAFIDDYNEKNETGHLHITGYSSFKTNVLGITILDFIEQVVDASFVPLTEFPVVYQHVKSGNYYPQPKKQNIKDRNGYLLPTNSPDFEMAPMAKVVSAPNSPEPEVMFCDFTLDGTSNDVYFYRVREIDSQMKMGKFSHFLGPVKLVNTNPPEAPEIRSVMPVLENKTLNIAPAIKFEINAYHPSQKIRRIFLYRTCNKLDAQSVRSMEMIKEIEITDEMIDQEFWTFEDDFINTENWVEAPPYGIALYYRVTVAREVEYMEASSLVTGYAPSKPSKILGTVIVESSAPESPVLEGQTGTLVGGQLHNVVLEWNQTINNGKYHVYRMNPQGNWAQITELPAGTLALTLEPLDILDTEGKTKYNHFKVLAENSSGMFSTEENILIIPQS